MSDLQIFANRYNLDVGRLEYQHTGQDPLRVESAGRQAFDGRVDYIRIEKFGRFGNSVYATLNALLINRTLKADHIILPPFTGPAPSFPIIIGDLELIASEQPAVAAPTLFGQFFAPDGLESLAGHYSETDILKLVSTYLRPIYAGLLDQAGLLGPRVAALHFRAGDIFVPGGGHAGYVQPPTSYYTRSFDFLAENFGVTRAHLVYEDRSNPTVELVAEALAQRGVALTLQSASMEQDLVTLLSAHHLIAPYGTFCEAVALLSTTLQTYTSFRRAATQRNIFHWVQSRLGEILWAKGIRTYVIDDPDNSYIPPDRWARTDEQLDLLCNFPEVKLRHMEKINTAAAAAPHSIRNT